MNEIVEVAAGWPSCLVCKAQLNAATRATDDEPFDTTDPLGDMDGAVSVCFHCGHVAMYVVDRGNVALRPLRADERWKILQEPAVAAAVAFVAQSRAMVVPEDEAGMLEHFTQQHRITPTGSKSYAALVEWHAVDHMVNKGSDTTAGQHRHVGQ